MNDQLVDEIRGKQPMKEEVKSPGLLRQVKSNLRMFSTKKSIYWLAGIAALLSAATAGTGSLVAITIVLGLAASVMAGVANDGAMLRTMAVMTPKRGKLLVGQVVSAMLVVTAIFAVCAVLAVPIALASGAAIASVLTSCGLTFLGSVLLSLLMYATTMVTKSPLATSGLIASGLIAAFLIGQMGIIQLLSIVPITAALLIGAGIGVSVLLATVCLGTWGAAVSAFASRRFLRADFGH